MTSGGHREEYQRCPYVQFGIEQSDMPLCPHYEPGDVDVRDLVPWDVTVSPAHHHTAATCAHLGVQESHGAFVPACLFPGGPA